MKLSVVTVTYKSDEEELDLFIKSFLKYNDLGDNAKLIVVDNSPSDYRIVENLIASRYGGMVLYVSNPSNPGFGASNNIGFDQISSEYVLFINNDVEFQMPVFQSIICEFERNLSIGCIGIHQDGGSPSFFQKMTSPQNIQLKTFDEKYHFISGAFMFFRSDIFKQIGMFDEELFMYFEEFDLGERLMHCGYHVGYLPNLKFLHKVGNRRRTREFPSRKGVQSFFYICKKYNLNPHDFLGNKISRLRKLQMYWLLHLDIKEIIVIQRVINVWKENISKYETNN